MNQQGAGGEEMDRLVAVDVAGEVPEVGTGPQALGRHLRQHGQDVLGPAAQAPVVLDGQR